MAGLAQTVGEIVCMWDWYWCWDRRRSTFSKAGAHRRAARKPQAQLDIAKVPNITTGEDTTRWTPSPILGSPPRSRSLKDLIQQLTDEEQEVSYRRRILHGKIDILRCRAGQPPAQEARGRREVISAPTSAS
jgi:hypothetical protein